jgi:transcriptional regulator with XRE-family HTH domain
MPTLRDIREANYVSRRELAALSGVSDSTIVRLEHRSTRVNRETVEKILLALSKRIGKDLSIGDIEGLNLYNVMRDRRQRRKADERT